EAALVGIGRLVGEPARQQEVAGVAVLHGHDLAGLAELVDILSQDHVHGSSPLMCCQLSPRARRASARQSTQVSDTPRASAPKTTSGSRKIVARKLSSAANGPLTPAAAPSPATTPRPRRR